MSEAQVFASLASSGTGAPLGGPPARPHLASSVPLALVGSRLPLGVLLGLGPR